MDYKKARKQLKKIKTLLDSFESLGEPMSEMEAMLLRKYADEFKQIVPHFQEEEIVTAAQPKVESAIISLKGDIEEKEVNPKIEVSEEYDVAPIVEQVEEHVAVEATPVVEAKVVEPVAVESPVVKAKPIAKKPAVKKQPKKKLLVAEHEEEIENISLWDPVEIKELSQRLSFSPIKNVFKAISINERIFTQNELFNGDNLSFRATLEKIETMSSFEEASLFLKSGVATENEWTNPKKIKKAKEFMRLVQRRFI